MPKLREYEAQVSSQYESRQRSATGEDFNLGAGTAAVGKGLESVADTLQLQAEREDVTRVHVELAKARADWTVYMQEAIKAAPAGDTSFTSGFMQKFDDYLARAGENIAQTPKGKQLFTTASADLRAGMLEKAGLYQAQSIGEKAKTDHKAVLDANRNVLLGDPTQFESVLRSTDGMIDDPNGLYAGLPGAAREQLRLQARQQLSLSAVQGVIQMNPELAKRQLESGRWKDYLDADNTHALLKEAEVGIHARQTASDRERALADRARKEAQEKSMNTFLSRIVSPGLNGGSPLDQEILTDPSLTPAQKQGLIDYKTRRAVEYRAGINVRANPMEVRQLRDSVFAAANDTAKLAEMEDAVLAAGTAGRISTDETMLLREDIHALRNPEMRDFQKDLQVARSRVYDAFARSAAGRIDPTAAEDSAHRFAIDLNRKIAAKRKAGEDPRTLLDPESKDYALAPGVVQTFFKLPQEALAAVAARQRADIPSYKDFDKLKSGDEFVDPKGNVRRKP